MFGSSCLLESFSFVRVFFKNTICILAVESPSRCSQKCSEAFGTSRDPFNWRAVGLEIGQAVSFVIEKGSITQIILPYSRRLLGEQLRFRSYTTLFLQYFTDEIWWKVLIKCGLTLGLFSLLFLSIGWRLLALTSWFCNSLLKLHRKVRERGGISKLIKLATLRMHSDRFGSWNCRILHFSVARVWKSSHFNF